jgi:predicted acylesterase/phospholipase RssA
MTDMLDQIDAWSSFAAFPSALRAGAHMIGAEDRRGTDMTLVSRALVLSGGGGRGSYQAGVWAWLEEQGWKPDLVSGSSVGAINGAAIASGVSAEQLKELGCSIDSAHVFHRRRWRNFVHWVKRLFGYAQRFAPLADTQSLRPARRHQGCRLCRPRTS